MKNNAQQKSPTQTTRAPFRTLEGWALGVLIENHAISECSDHGHRRDKADPEAWNHAREEAWRNPFPGKSPEACLVALDEVMRSIGDTCPDCTQSDSTLARSSYIELNSVQVEFEYGPARQLEGLSAAVPCDMPDRAVPCDFRVGED